MGIHTEMQYDNNPCGAIGDDDSYSYCCGSSITLRLRPGLVFPTGKTVEEATALGAEPEREGIYRMPLPVDLITYVLDDGMMKSENSCTTIQEINERLVITKVRELARIEELAEVFLKDFLKEMKFYKKYGGNKPHTPKTYEQIYAERRKYATVKTYKGWELVNTVEHFL